MVQDPGGEALIAAIGQMRVVDLSHTIEERMPVFRTHPQYFHMKWHTDDPATLHQLLISEHAGTHLDAPLHFYSDPSDPRRIALDHVPLTSCIGRAVKFDFLALPHASELSAEDIREKESAQGTPLRQGDAIVLRFGWDAKWAPVPAGNEFTSAWPGISRSAAHYLVERGVRLVGTDCLGIDSSATADLGAHFTLLERGILIVENLRNLGAVPTLFLLLTLPLKIRDGSGSPIRAVGLVSETRGTG